MTRREQAAGARSRTVRSILAIIALVLLVSTACSDAADEGAALSAGEQASTTTIRLAPTTESPTASSESDQTSTTAPSTTTTSGAAGSPWPEMAFTLTPVAEVSQPTAIAVRAGSDDLWLTERSGRMRRVARLAGGEDDAASFELVEEPVVDIEDVVTTDGEGGLLGATFSPDGELLYLHYTDNDGDNVIAEFTMTGDRAEAGSQREVLTVDQPFSNHNGGDLTFGPDGMLYVSLGDGGGGGDPRLNGQDRTTLLGAVLRIDPRPDQGSAYRVPADNPFVGSTDDFRPEIWVWGARNPWRFSFDAATGDLWIADVGQDRFEEVNLLPASADGGRGANLGWNLMEANESFAGAEPSDHRPPLYAYEQREGRCSVTGGYVYRGSAVPALDGVYLFGDYCARELTGLAAAGDGTATIADLVTDREVENVIGFGQGPRNELYVLEQGGRVSLLQSS